jgi:hypothetical protein
VSAPEDRGVVAEQIRARPTTRLPWVDRLKITIIVGVIVVHVATAYVVNVR